MKYIVLLCDGMADLPLAELGGKTPMEVADKPCMNALAVCSELGRVKTVADGMSPGSDVANLAVMGYDASTCYTGRSPLEAANIGITMEDGDLAYRCNLVTLSDEAVFENKTMVDYCAGDIHTEQAAEIIAAVRNAFGSERFSFFVGTAYRHCMIRHNSSVAEGAVKLTPPHDITGRVIGEYSPEDAEVLDLMKRSMEVLASHPVNLDRAAKGLPQANAIWLWGQGSRPVLPDYRGMFGVDGAMISAVDLLKGIGRLSGMDVCEVDGATGYIDTNYEGKTAAAVDALLNQGRDFVYIHVEAPDECGHRGQLSEKIQSIGDIDRRVLTPLKAALDNSGEDYRILILPDHPTPIALKTHTSDPVPYLLYDSRPDCQVVSHGNFSEVGVADAEMVEPGYSLIRRLFAQ